MSHYHHITPEEREKIFFFKAKDFSITQIAKETGRSKSTISRELKRNTFEKAVFTSRSTKGIQAT